MSKKTVTLFRHAKSGQKNVPEIDDFDRPLSNRGLKTAPKMGVAMRDRHIRPDLILCSPAIRTRQTLTLASAEAWDHPPKVRFEKKLYEASPQGMFKLLKACPEEAAHVMLVGHNPGLQDLAVDLCGPWSKEHQRLSEKLPTGSVVSFEFDDVLWKDLKPGTGEVRLFITPKTLPPA